MLLFTEFNNCLRVFSTKHNNKTQNVNIHMWDYTTTIPVPKLMLNIIISYILTKLRLLQ